jgi:hypothetical protein
MDSAPSQAAPTDAPQSIALSLVAHTNVGKTTLARTLLGRDIGEVRDEPHVTEFADVHTMLESPQGDRLQLWDTPGFGDSVRLLRRLRQSNNPIGWFLSQVWDRWRERPFWAAQQALKNVRDEADVLLYLVSAAETPQAAGYVKPELELLAWTGKPVIVLLNQLGTPRPGGADDVAPWRRHIDTLAPGSRVLPFDAFARCWVQEIVLLEAIADTLPAERRAAMARLIAAWRPSGWRPSPPRWRSSPKAWPASPRPGSWSRKAPASAPGCAALPRRPCAGAPAPTTRPCRRRRACASSSASRCAKARRR